MSSITTKVDAGFREACIQTWGAYQWVKARARDDRGIVSAEYMGVLLVVGMIIFALVSEVKIHEKISKAINSLVDDISKGDKPNPA